MHQADRLLEQADALLTLVRSMACDAGDDGWQESRLGIAMITKQIQTATRDARKALDEA